MERATIEKKIEDVAKKIVAGFQPEKIILFGSYAWGEPGPDSDVDLFIVKKTDNSTREIAREIDGSIFPRPFPIDLVVYTPEQVEKWRTIDFFIKNIFAKGKVLYAK
ncbi:MAG: DNA polymerase subunit beta [Parcubacteria group bacterium Gr01-1014_66]|nr:MAG: DNA polymerase subunit beta [Parcubacteria group bacterium Gr01-1014_66]